MNRHERRKVRKTGELTKLFMVAATSGPYDHSIVIIGVDDHGWSIWPKRPPPPELLSFLAEHHDRLRALMDKPVLLNVFWDDGDEDATVSILTDEGDPGTPFKTFRLPFTASA
jgi:hypothetical protein